MAYGRSLMLLIPAVVLGSSAGVLLGLISGLRPGSRWAGLASAVSFLGVLLPSFLLSIFVLLFFVRYVTPAFGGIRFVLIRPDVAVFDPRRMIAPTMVLAVRPMALVAQITIGALQEVVNRDYIRTAYAKGLRPRTILLRHIVPNITLPVLTGINSSFFYSLSSLLVVEFLFIWRGIGSLLLDAVEQRDAILASYALLAIGVTLLVVNTSIRAVSRKVDPRVGELETVVS